EPRDREVASQDDDWNSDCVEDVGQLGRSRACIRIVAVEGSETDPAASGRDWLSSHFRGSRKRCTARGCAGGLDLQPSGETDSVPATVPGSAAWSYPAAIGRATRCR